METTICTCSDASDFFNLVKNRGTKAFEKKKLQTKTKFHEEMIKGVV